MKKSIVKIMILSLICAVFSSSAMVFADLPASTKPMPIKPIHPHKPIKPNKPFNRHVYGNTVVVQEDAIETCEDIEFNGRWRKENLCQTEHEWAQYKKDHHCKERNNTLHCSK